MGISFALFKCLIILFEDVSAKCCTLPKAFTEK